MQPLVEGRLFFGDNKEGHVSMLQATEFGALPAIQADTLGPDGNLVAATRNQVLLAGEARHPERMDDVGALKQKSHIDSDRNVNFVRGRKTPIRCGAEVLDIPPPLLASHLDREIVLTCDAQGPGR